MKTKPWGGGTWNNKESSSTTHLQYNLPAKSPNSYWRLRYFGPKTENYSDSTNIICYLGIQELENCWLNHEFNAFLGFPLNYEIIDSRTNICFVRTTTPTTPSSSCQDLISAWPILGQDCRDWHLKLLFISKECHVPSTSPERLPWT